MGGYGVFAEFYDRLTTDVDYGPWADYLLSLFEKHGRGRPETLLDLACGSGSLSLELASRGVDVIGVDGSEDMLSLGHGQGGAGESRADVPGAGYAGAGFVRHGQRRGSAC